MIRASLSSLLSNKKQRERLIIDVKKRDTLLLPSLLSLLLSLTSSSWSSPSTSKSKKEIRHHRHCGRGRRGHHTPSIGGEVCGHHTNCIGGK